jgi:hypothetical protein
MKHEPDAEGNRRSSRDRRSGHAHCSVRRRSPPSRSARRDTVERPDQREWRGVGSGTGGLERRSFERGRSARGGLQRDHLGRRLIERWTVNGCRAHQGLDHPDTEQIGQRKTNREAGGYVNTGQADTGQADTGQAGSPSRWGFRRRHPPRYELPDLPGRQLLARRRCVATGRPAQRSVAERDGCINPQAAP